MRNFVHMTLSKGLQVAVPTALGFLAAAMEIDQDATKSWLGGIDWPNTSLLLFLISLLVVVAIYLTRDVSLRQRAKIIKSLRNIHYTLVSYEKRLKGNDVNPDTSGLKAEIDLEWREMTSCIEDTMGKFALAKLLSGSSRGMGFNWGNALSPDETKIRSDLLEEVLYRTKLVDELILSPAWDDPPPPKFMERLKWW